MRKAYTQLIRLVRDLNHERAYFLNYLVIFVFCRQPIAV
jgi:hypothetical protein